MSLQKDMTLNGGAVVSNCYVRIYSVEAVRANEDSDWTLKVLTHVYKDKSSRTAGDPAGSEAVHLHTPQYKEYIFDYDPSSETGDLISVAYDKLKTHEDYIGASDV
jgi:hypothetical protein